MALWTRQFGDVCCRYTLEDVPKNNCVMHTHDVLELYYFLSGDCTYLIEGTAYRLKPHDIIFKRPLEAHKLIVNSPDVPYERVGITLPIDLFNSIDNDNVFEMLMRRPLGTNNRFTADDFGNSLCVDMLTDIARHGKTMTRTELLSRIFVIVSEADRVLKQKNHTPQQEQRATSVGARLIDYTNEHLFTDITMKQLTDRFFLSYSQINRIFKQHTGTSARQYITAKRLLTARDRIRHGASPADACYSCGYNDYSTFYRAYVQYFGHPPKSDLGTTAFLPEIRSEE